MGQAQRVELDLQNNLHQQLVVAGMAGMIDEQGLTFHEMMEVIEQIKRECFPALMEMSRENREVKGNGV